MTAIQALATAVTGLVAPAIGANPVATITPGIGYTGTVTWSGNPSTFAASTAYTATVTLTAATGYSFSSTAANVVTTAEFTGSSAATNTVGTSTQVVITVTYPAIATVINTAAISGVTVPATGATPATTVTGTGYTGIITWNGIPATFAGGVAYTATVTLTPAAGYTLSGVAANFFTVAGATSVTNLVNSGVITAVFPATVVALPAGYIQTQTATGGTIGSGSGWALNGGGTLTWAKVTDASARNWYAAASACSASTQLGYAAGTWRMPTQGELSALLNTSRAAAVSAGWSFSSNSYTWSSTSDGNGNYYYVKLSNGSISGDSPYNSNNVACVH